MKRGLDKRCDGLEERLKVGMFAIYILLNIQTSFSFHIAGQHTPVNFQCPAAVASFPSNTVNYWTEVLKKKYY